jgi:hypothetical protein
LSLAIINVFSFVLWARLDNSMKGCKGYQHRVRIDNGMALVEAYSICVVVSCGISMSYLLESLGFSLSRWYGQIRKQSVGYWCRAQQPQRSPFRSLEECGTTPALRVAWATFGEVGAARWSTTNGKGLGPVRLSGSGVSASWSHAASLHNSLPL